MKVVAASLASFVAVGVLGFGSLADPVGAIPDLDPAKLADAVLTHPSIRLLPAARTDVERGFVDPRVLKILIVLAERHELTRVGPLVSGHSYYVRGSTRPSNHAFGRAVDIAAIDGSGVSLHNAGAYDAVQMLGSLNEQLRPDEIGAPWPLTLQGISTFTQGHAGHLHAGFSVQAGS